MRVGPKIRLHILTGFLGSGKSTLLRQHLAAHSHPTAVFINEFGATPIDHALMAAIRTDPITIAGGCVCCTTDTKLRDGLIEFITKTERGEISPVNDIVLETSGLSDPSRIIATLRSDLHLAEYLTIESCTTTVEANATVADMELHPTIVNQIATASQVVITKTDLHDEPTHRAASKLVSQLNPTAIVSLSPSDTFQPVDLFTSGRIALGPISPVSNHTIGISTFEIDTTTRSDWPSFSVWLTALLHRHGQHILRFKGVISSEDGEDLLALQSVRHVVYPPEHIKLPNRRTPERRVFICDHDLELPIRASLAALDATLNPPPPEV